MLYVDFYKEYVADLSKIKAVVSKEDDTIMTGIEFERNVDIQGDKNVHNLDYEDPPSYEVSYRNKDIQFCINANELENFINKLVIKEHFKTLKVKSEHIKEAEK